MHGDSAYQYWEWILTILFYATLHYIKAFLSLKYSLPSNKISSHRGIQSELNKLKKQRKIPKNIVTTYEQFKNYSQMARYRYLETYNDFNDVDFIEFVSSSCYQMYELLRDYVLKELDSYDPII